ncbi:hypothetical protein GP486_004630 [Trichoglossum hirsutum]|uniref:Uncharacterized protein n=1 Tax=Trichoglossum hirsutum TaxID=265104 RepID=A0A9P8LAU0_9PEZI|nr:hypothetical protein GP486_004630 [Trichoglossum hirsutum]
MELFGNTPGANSNTFLVRSVDGTQDPKHNVIREGPLPSTALDEFLDQKGKHTIPPTPDGCTFLGAQRLIIQRYLTPWEDGFYYALPWEDKVVMAKTSTYSSDDYLGFMATSPWADDFWSLVTSYDPQTRTTSHVLGLRDGALIHNIEANLKAVVNIAHLPLVVPLVAHISNMSYVSTTGDMIRNNLFTVDLALGINGYPVSGIPSTEVERLKGNFALLNQKIVSTNEMFSGERFVFVVRYSKTLRMASKILDSMTENPGFSKARGIFEETLDVLEQDLEFQQVIYSTLGDRIRFYASVLYNLIAQRDSELNISVARDSRWIASASKKDSSAMKTIAVLTLVFLPGTFVASIFSSTIFDFRSESILSNKFWIYWVVTLPLTALVIALWIAWYRWNDKKLMKENKDLEDGMDAGILAKRQL